MSNLVKTPERLKLSILNYALSGELTKQLPSDGDAHDLVNNIINKKQKLIKSHKIRKHRKLPIINKNEIPFNIPNNWCWVHFLSLYEFLEGTPQKSFCIKHWEKGYIRLYQIRDYRNEYNTKTIFLPKNKARRIAYRGNILIAKIGSLGSVFKANHMGAYGANLAKITPIIRDHELNTSFVFYYLKSNLYQSIVRAINNKAVQQYLSNKDLMKLIIPVPPLSEQHRIVQRLNEILPAVDDLNKDVVELDQIRTKFPHRLKQSLLLEAMKGHLTQQLPSDGTADDLLQKIQQKKQQLIRAGKIRKHKKLPPINKDEIPFKIPKNWKWVRLPCLLKLENGSIRRGPFGSSLRKSSFVPKATNTYKVYEQGNAIHKSINYGDYYITDKKYKKLHSFHVKSGDIIISGAGTIGKTYILPHNCPKGVINQALIRIRLNNNIIDTQFFLFLFDQKLGKIRRDSIGSAIKNMASIRVLKKKLVWQLPPLSEQHRIVSKLHDLFNTINA